MTQPFRLAAEAPLPTPPGVNRPADEPAFDLALGPCPPFAALADGDPSWTLARGATGADTGAARATGTAGAPGAAGAVALWPLTGPAAVEGVHLAAIRAGARLVRTHTRWASPAWLPEVPVERIEELNLWAAKLARSARELAGERCLVAGFLGPLPAQGSIPAEAVLGGYRRQVAGLLAGGVDLFWIEARSPREAAAALAAVREASRLPVGVVWVAGSQAGSERAAAAGGEGETPAALAQGWLAPLQAVGLPDAVGVATRDGPAEAAHWLAALRRAGWGGPLWVTLGRIDAPAHPAGTAGPDPDLHPRQDRRREPAPPRDGEHDPSRHRTAPPAASPGAVAPDARDPWTDGWDALRLLGVGWVGGTGAWSPADLAGLGARIRQAPAPAAPDEPARAVAVAVRTHPAGPAPAQDAALRSVADTLGPATDALRPPAAALQPVADALRRGAEAPRQPVPLREKLGRRFVISVELDPPRGPVATKFIADARTVAAAGADAVNVGDSPMARPRMAALAGAYLARTAGIDAIMHCTTRDRNLMALQADLLAAHALGVRNVLALTGDHPRLGTSGASPVYDVDSIGLLEVLAALRRGEDPQGNALGAPADFTVACALSPCADDLDRELERFRRKLAVGVVDFVMTQPLYEVEPLERVLDRLGGCPVPVVMGVMPLHSGRHAHYLHHQVPGITIPARIREALDRAGDRGLEVGLELAEAVVEAARPCIAGVYVVVSYGKAEPVAEFVRRLRTRLDPSLAPAGPRGQEEVRHHAG